MALSPGQVPSLPLSAMILVASPPCLKNANPCGRRDASTLEFLTHARATHSANPSFAQSGI